MDDPRVCRIGSVTVEILDGAIVIRSVAPAAVCDPHDPADAPDGVTVPEWLPPPIR